MTDDLELASLISLLRTSQVRWGDIPEMVEEAGSASCILEARFTNTQTSLFDDTSTESDIERLTAEALRDIETWRAEGMNVVSVLDDDYPVNLRSVYDRPPILFIRGTFMAEDSRAVAVVGSRSATPAALTDAANAATGLIDAGYTVLSGLATGIDGAAHRAAIEAGGRTVAVIGTGLRRTYPKENATLQQEIADEFAVISQFWPDQPPGKHTFPMRNAVMSGLAKATLVVEASERSGARIQARKALEHGRPVFFMPRLLETRWARDYAERPGTMVVETIAEVVERLDKLTAAAEHFAAA